MNYLRCIETCPLVDKELVGKSVFEEAKSLKICTIKDRELYFAPVGNATDNPSVIICGQTPDFSTMTTFWELIKQGYSVEYAGTKTVYSNKTMRKNLFRSLSEINFFELMNLLNSRWNLQELCKIWESLFEDAESGCNLGVQLTQSCNCAIVKGKGSQQPPRAIFSEIYKQVPDCLFNSFQINENLKLIVFLDSPSRDGRFHQIDFFEKTDKYKWCKEHNVEIISVPHPSGANRIYNKSNNLSENKHIKEAKNVIKKLIDLYKRKENFNND